MSEKRAAEKRILLKEQDIPHRWYNINADFKNPMAPPLNPQTKQPLAPQDLAAIFPEALIEQEVSTQRWIDIPEEILDVYSLWRPTPLHRAYKLEEALGTPAKIYYKNESTSPAGSHKPNTAVAQAYYNKKAGIRRLSTETGAGQWGSALSFACTLFDLECLVYMVKVSYQQKPYRRSLMQVWGSDVIPSPSDKTQAGRDILAKDPDSPGSLGIAISEAVEDAATHDDTNYSLGSVLNHVVLHQSVIGQEAKKQFDLVGDYPDIIVGCCGGGSNFAGLVVPFVADKIAGTHNPRAIAVEPTACPTLTKGKLAYDYGDTARLTPLVYMHTLGHDFVPAKIHAGGLRYHGVGPIVSHMLKEGLIEANAVHQNGIFEAALLFARTEGILPAPESAHAIRGAMDEALKCRETGEAKTILFGLSGHGHFDLTAYDNYLSGNLEDYEMPEDAIAKALEALPTV